MKINVNEIELAQDSNDNPLNKKQIKKENKAKAKKTIKKMKKN